MTYFNEEELETLDIDWVAVDSVGNIGNFCSAGIGFLPQSILSSKENSIFVGDYIDSLSICSEPVLVESFLTKHEKANVVQLKYFLDIASKGVYAFDACCVNGKFKGYRPIAIPKKPLKLDVLPEDVKVCISKAILRGHAFDESLLINQEMF